MLRAVAEDVTISIAEADIVIDGQENASLSSRLEKHRSSSQVAAAKGGKADKEGHGAPLLEFFVDACEFRFKHGDPCKLDVRAEYPPEVMPPPQVLAGTVLDVCVRCLDAFGNPCTDVGWWAASKWAVAVTLDEEALPKLEPHTLHTSMLNGILNGAGTGGGGGGDAAAGKGGGGAKGGGGGMSLVPSRLPSGSKPHSVTETATGEFKKTSALKLTNGEARLKVNATVAGELRLSVSHQHAGAAVKGKAGGGGGGGGAFDRELLPGESALPVKSGRAEHFDLVPLDQGAHAMRVMVHARDAFGNLDEECESEVVLQLEGAQGEFPRVMLADGGHVKLSQGVAEVSTVAVHSQAEASRLKAAADRPQSAGRSATIGIQAGGANG